MLGASIHLRVCVFAISLGRDVGCVFHLRVSRDVRELMGCQNLVLPLVPHAK